MWIDLTISSVAAYQEAVYFVTHTQKPDPVTVTPASPTLDTNELVPGLRYPLCQLILKKSTNYTPDQY